jgi:hypothetical protein
MANLQCLEGASRYDITNLRHLGVAVESGVRRLPLRFEAIAQGYRSAKRMI